MARGVIGPLIALLASVGCMDPKNADRRRRQAPRAGRAKPNKELAGLRGQLAELYSSVLDGEVEPKVGAVLAQIANARTRLLETEIKLKKQQELEERLEALEDALRERKEGARRVWG